MKKIYFFIIGTILSTTILFANSIEANIVKVTTTKSQDSYRFNITIKSLETGCKQYCDWWEVINSKGELLYRRVLFHSHPGEQPFTRSGGSIKLDINEKVYIRAHMNKFSYSGNVFEGSISSGFNESKNVPTFSNKIESTKPLPNGCAF